MFSQGSSVHRTAGVHVDYTMRLTQVLQLALLLLPQLTWLAQSSATSAARRLATVTIAFAYSNGSGRGNSTALAAACTRSGLRAVGR